MFLKVSFILMVCLFGTSLCTPVSTDEVLKEAGKPLVTNEKDQRQLESVVGALLGGFLPQIQSALSNAIQGAASNLLNNFSIWDLIRENAEIPKQFLEDSPAFDSYVVNLPNVGSFVILAANKIKGNGNVNNKPIILNEADQTKPEFYKPIPYKPAVDSELPSITALPYQPPVDSEQPSLTSHPYKPVIDSDNIELHKPEYVQNNKPIKKPYYIGSLPHKPTIDSHDIEYDRPEYDHDFKPNKKPYDHHIASHFDKKKASISDKLSILQHKFHEQKEKILAETVNHINKLQAQLLGEIHEDYHHVPPNYYNEYETPHIIKKPIKKPKGHYIGYKATNVQRESDFE